MPLLFFIAAASAQQVELRDPGTLSGEWTEGIQAGESDSARAFLAFTGHGLIEQAFALQHAPLQGSAITAPGSGVAFGVAFDTFPFRAAPVNGQGKEENTRFLPAAPRLTASFTGGETLVYGAGFSFVPPVEVAGASAMIVGVDASLAVGVTRWLRVGVEADATSGQAYAPVVATAEQEADGVLGNVNEARYEAMCVPQENGCIDVLLVRHGGVHAAALFPFNARVQPWLRVGGRYVDDRFRIEVDLSDWRVHGVVPDASVGANVLLDPRLRIGVGAMVAPLGPDVTQAGELPLLYRFSVGVAWAPRLNPA